MKVTGIDCHILLVPEYSVEANSSAQDNLVVEVHADNGLTGIGETDTNPWVAKACIEAPGTHVMGQGLKEMLLGRDPEDVETIWWDLYNGSKMTGRRGALICAMGAIDMALWDLRAKARGVPVHRLLGESAREFITPYASLLPDGNTLAEYGDSLLYKLTTARDLGYRAAKLEICINGPYSHNGLQEDDAHGVAMVEACRKAVGPDFTLMVDVAYSWPDPETALRVIQQLAPLDIFFLETPLDIDDLDGHAWLQARSPIPLAAGEWQNTHFEFEDLALRGKLDVLQPDIGRVGGFTPALEVRDLAARTERLIVPHCWKTGIGIAASAHFAAVAPMCPYIEFLPANLSESALRRELTHDEIKLEDGVIPLPRQPGLGVELNRTALERYKVG